ncbi:MAG: FAD-dependent monooxygenase, partial [Pseudolabrys sp.]
MRVAIVGGGICGLTLALNLKERGIPCRVYERAPEIRELGVGITLLPHAMREFTTLGLGDALLKAGI